MEEHQIKRRKAVDTSACASQLQSHGVTSDEGAEFRMQGRNGAISVIAMAERGALFDPGPCMYMEKLAGALPEHRRVIPWKATKQEQTYMFLSGKICLFDHC